MNPDEDMNFNEVIKHITGEKLHLYRARLWMERYIAENLAINREALKFWYDREGDMEFQYAEFHRDWFARWKREYESRKAKESRSKRKKKRKPRLPTA